jgi:hypothetical protein
MDFNDQYRPTKRPRLGDDLIWPQMSMHSDPIQLANLTGSFPSPSTQQYIGNAHSHIDITTGYSYGFEPGSSSVGEQWIANGPQLPPGTEWQLPNTEFSLNESIPNLSHQYCSGNTQFSFPGHPNFMIYPAPSIEPFASRPCLADHIPVPSAPLDPVYAPASLPDYVLHQHSLDSMGQLPLKPETPRTTDLGFGSTVHSYLGVQEQPEHCGDDTVCFGMVSSRLSKIKRHHVEKPTTNS